MYTGGIENAISVWDLRKGEVSMSMPGHTDTITGLSVSPDGNLLLSNAMVRPPAQEDISQAQCRCLGIWSLPYLA